MLEVPGGLDSHVLTSSWSSVLGISGMGMTTSKPMGVHACKYAYMFKDHGGPWAALANTECKEVKQ